MENVSMRLVFSLNIEVLSGPYTCKQFEQTECLHKHFDSVGCCLHACANCLRGIKTIHYEAMCD